MDLDVLRDGIGAATLDDGSPVSPTEARRMACEVGVIPAVLGGAGQVLDLGRERACSSVRCGVPGLPGIVGVRFPGGTGRRVGVKSIMCGRGSTAGRRH